MRFSILLLSTVAAFAATTQAQCLVLGGGSPVTLSNPDDALSAELPMGISFPMAGATGTPYTHCVVSTNGLIYLTNGAGATNAAGNQWGSIGELQGTAGASPRIAPFWTDLWDALYPGVAWGVTSDSSVPGRFAVTWQDTCEWGSDVPPCDFRVELFDTGVVTFSYRNFDTAVFFTNAYVGVSVGNAVANPGEVDLSSGPIGLTGLVFEEFAPGDFDLQSRSITFTPLSPGYLVTTTCQQLPASNTSYGTGCYSLSDSLYQFLADATAAAPALTGQSMQWTPAGNSYLATWGGGTYVAPVAATTLTGFVPLLDDGRLTVTLGSPFPIPGGTTSSLVVHTNGNVWFADNYAALTFDYDPQVVEMLNAPNGGFWSWHDYAPNDTGSGQIKFEEIGNVTYITWDNVDSWPLNVVNTSTLQFQFDRSTGVVTIVWVSIDGNASSAYGSAHLVGYSPGGPSTDTGSTDLATALPLLTGATNLLPVTLSASPAPISTATTGTNVVYTTDNLYAFTPGNYLAVGVLSFVQIPGGVDLGFLGAPGCSAYIGSLDATVGLTGATPSLGFTLPIPPGVPPGIFLAVQTLNLIVPNSLPNGQNSLGIAFSNGVFTYVSNF